MKTIGFRLMLVWQNGYVPACRSLFSLKKKKGLGNKEKADSGLTRFNSGHQLRAQKNPANLKRC